MLKISKPTLEAFHNSQSNDFRKRAIAYVYNEEIVKSDMDEVSLNKVLKFTEDYSADAIILAEQSRLTMFVLGIQHGRELFFDEEAKFLSDAQIPERIKVRKLIELCNSRRQPND